MRLPAKARKARLLTRRRNALLAEVERWALAKAPERDHVALTGAIYAYVRAKYPRRTIAALKTDRILAPELARIVFPLY